MHVAFAVTEVDVMSVMETRSDRVVDEDDRVLGLLDLGAVEKAALGALEMGEQAELACD